MTDPISAPDAAAKTSNQDKVMSYMAVRRALGLIGLLLPLGLLIYGKLFVDDLRGQDFPNSISDFYHTPAGDVLVGALCAMGVFFISYKGYDTPSKIGLRDKWLARAAGILVIFVAIFPVHPESTGESYPICQEIGCYIQGFTGHLEALHYISAVLFFITLALFCFLQFPMSEQRTKLGQLENPLYHLCGGVITASVLLFLVYGYASSRAPETLAWMKARDYLFWVESIGVWAFAVSWLIKGLPKSKKP